LSASSGIVHVEGLAPAQAWSRIAYVFQSARLVPWRTALDNVLLATDLRFGRKDRAARRERAHEMLTLVGLGSDGHKFPRMLSGGERQRVAIARALSVEPDIILMDEPFASLDPNTRVRMRLETARIWEATKKTVVFVTHDVDEALLLADRIVMFSKKPAQVQKILTLREPHPRTIDDPVMLAHRAGLIAMYKSVE